MGVSKGRKKQLSELHQLPVNPWSRLRLGILLQAVYDWRLCLAQGERNYCPGNLIELRNFFQSDWCQKLMAGMENIQAEDILRVLEEERARAAG